MTPLNKAVLRLRYAFACNIFERIKTANKNVLTALIVMLPASGIGGQAFASLQPYVIGSDRGGFIRERQLEIRRLQASGQPVEIRGALCYSTCTMLLGLPQTCVSPNTEFGFHGPSRSGTRLGAAEFEYYSQLIAQYYPSQLKDWFLKKGRNRINGVHRIKGSEIIRMGIKKCEP